MEAILFQHLSPSFRREKGTTSLSASTLPNPDGVFTEVIFGPRWMEGLTQPIKGTDDDGQFHLP